MRSNRLKSRASINITMYQLADKYLIPSLKAYASLDLDWCLGGQKSYRAVYYTVRYSGMSFNSMGEELKTVLAQHVASDYMALWNGNDEAAKGIKDWFRGDDDFVFLVMDSLASGPRK